MSSQSNNFWKRSVARNFVRWGALCLLAQWSAFADQSVTLTWNPSPNTNAAGYKIYYGGASRVYTNSVILGLVTNVTVGGLSEGATYYFGATTVDGASHESAFSNEATYAIPLTEVTNSVVGVNQPPTLDAIANWTIYQNAGVQMVALTGISPGSTNAGQTVAVSAVSSDASVIPAPTVIYTSPSSTGTLTFAPAVGALGTATVTVTVDNGGASNNITTQIFTVTVVPVSVGNLPPTFDALTNVTIYQNAGVQTVSLAHINSGLADGNQNVSVFANTSDDTIIPVPTVSYTNGNDLGSLTFAPVANALGTATVTVTIDNGNPGNHLASQIFTVTVVPAPVVNLPPTLDGLTNLTIYQNAGLQTIALTGISSGSPAENQTLSVTAVSSDSSIIPAPVVNYSSPNSAGSLSFSPMANALGTATVTVTVNDGAASSNLIVRTFTVTVGLPPAATQLPGLDAIANVSVIQNAAAQTITLTGIAAGSATASPVIRVSASSSNPRIVPTPTIRYISPATTGTVTIKPMANALGVATITLTVNNGGRSNNIIRRSFTVTVLPNQPPTLDPIASIAVAENAGAQTILLTGISSGSPTENQTLRVSASSSNPRLVSGPQIQIQYASPANTALLTFRPTANRSGVATITVTVNDGSRNNNIVRQNFKVTVTAPVVTPAIANASLSSPVPAPASLAVGQDTAATLTTLAGRPGQFSFQVAGVPGAQYVVQATSDLLHWTSVQTNTAPFVFQDSSANDFRQRFYRAYYLP